jgi:hypothetical protein
VLLSRSSFSGKPSEVNLLHARLAPQRENLLVPESLAKSSARQCRLRSIIRQSMRANLSVVGIAGSL